MRTRPLGTPAGVNGGNCEILKPSCVRPLSWFVFLLLIHLPAITTPSASAEIEAQLGNISSNKPPYEEGHSHAVSASRSVNVSNGCSHGSPLAHRDASLPFSQEHILDVVSEHHPGAVGGISMNRHNDAINLPEQSLTEPFISQDLSEEL